MPYSPEQRAALKRACSRMVGGHPPPRPEDELHATADWMRAQGYEPDYYGTGRLMTDFEAKVAALLGKPAAVFMASGKMASMIAVRIWAERANNPLLGMHRTSHLELHEEHGYRDLHNLQACFLGEPDRPILAAHLAGCEAALSSVVLELPMREIGGRLPPWEDLREQRAIATGRGVRLHLDGARLWETRAFYGKSYAEIAALFDSVYVSFYKGIGGIAGAMLLGDADFIAEARVWLTRHGGTIFQQYPVVASAARRFDERLARMPAYLARARSLARALSALPGLAVVPDEPQANLFHLRFDVAAASWDQARDEIARTDGIWLGATRPPERTDGRAEVEIYVGENLMALSDDEVVAAYSKLLAEAACARPA